MAANLKRFIGSISIFVPDKFILLHSSISDYISIQTNWCSLNNDDYSLNQMVTEPVFLDFMLIGSFANCYVGFYY